MATYGRKYRFAFSAQNSSNVEIFILQKFYSGELKNRSLGRGPILKRDSSGCILGTSLELYAECQTPGEYRSLYTSAADDYKVQVYKDGLLVWTGFVTPELYSEPDLAPPYDVQIIATDGLGELKRSALYMEGEHTIGNYLKKILLNTGLNLSLKVVSTLTADGVDALSLVGNFESWNGVNSYDILQKLLASMHAVITQDNNSWVLMRETDLHASITSKGLTYYEDGVQKSESIPSFGSQTNKKWWPIGYMSNTVEPAKNHISLSSETTYRNAYTDWMLGGNLVEYDSTENKYTLFSAVNLGNSQLGTIGQRLLSKHDFTWSMRLRFTAGLYGSSGENTTRKLGVRIMIENQYGTKYYLRPSGLSQGTYSWTTGSDQSITSPWGYDLQQGVQDIDITLPFHMSDRMSFYAKSIAIELSRYSRDDGDIEITNLSVEPADQYSKIEMSARILNNAREESANVNVLFPASYALDYTSNPQDTMSAIPLHPDTHDYIKKWSCFNVEETDYTKFILSDYAGSVALPRIMINGKLNVPEYRWPFLLFESDSTYYLLRNFSYDLYADEIDVTLISIPNAIVEISQVQQLPISSSSGVSSGGSSSSGMVIGDQFWAVGADNNQISTDKEVVVNNNLIVSGDVASGSDIRFKEILEHKVLPIETIADAPLFKFLWKDREDNMPHLGSSAQYWERIAPELVCGEDFKRLNYASLGVAMGISLAKKMQEQEEIIKELRSEIERLKNGIC